MMATAYQAAVIRAQSPGGVDINTEFDGTIARWLLDQGGHCDRNVAAFQFGSEAVDSLLDLRASREMAEKAEIFNAGYLAVYQDFPDKALMIGETLEVSAIALLTQTNPGGQFGAPRVFAVVSPPGEFSRRILTWVWGLPDEVLATDALPPVGGPPNQEPVITDLLRAAGTTSLQLARTLQRIAVVTSWHAACEHDRGFANHLRKVDIRTAEELQDADEFLAPGSTFFNVPRLPPICRPARSAKSGRTRKLRT